MSRDSHQFHELSDRQATRPSVYTPASAEDATVSAASTAQCVADPTTDTDDADKHPEYTSGFRLAAVATGLILSAFCLGLASLPISSSLAGNLLTRPGPLHHLNRHPQNHLRVRLPRRCGLVRLGLFAHHVLLPAHVWQAVHRIQRHLHLPLCPVHLRGRVHRVCRGSFVHGPRCW